MVNVKLLNEKIASMEKDIFEEFKKRIESGNLKVYDAIFLADALELDDKEKTDIFFCE